ncbi:baseplate J/gp47 family protein [Azonexus sp. R2A61]|uniref:baseplate assembly protein n=1 Tax=Azonexus sp. R2A61 TaxID=2744443 RepID=UPI001F26D02F|nr:baseplate J/gp47 family protein [Azonexus sp. R2A61]
MTVDLSSLPAPDVVETLVFEAIVAEIKADFIARYPAGADVLDLESEPVVKLLEAFAYRELNLRARYNDEARAVMLAFAEGADLDHIGTTYYQEARLVVTPADLDTIPPMPAVMELDADYRNRLALKPESYSVAGPRDAFRFHAISADGQIKDASVDSPEGGTTRVFVLTRTGNGMPTPTQLATVTGALSGETVRPLSESVVVAAPEIVNYSLDLALTFFAGPSTEVGLAAAQAALARFAADSHRLDTDIIRSAIDAAAHVAGVKKVVIASPAADIVCTRGQAPYCTGINLTVAGVE